MAFPKYSCFLSLGFLLMACGQQAKMEGEGGMGGLSAPAARSSTAPALGANVVEFYAPASSGDTCVPGMGSPCPGGFGSGVVYEYADVILTAGHVVSSRDSQGNVVNTLPAGERVWYQGTPYSISQVIYHPNYFQGADLAVVHLSQPISGVIPAQPSKTELAQGDLVSMAGYGENKLTGAPGGESLHTGQLTFENTQTLDPSHPSNPLNTSIPNAYLIFWPGPQGTIGCEGDSGSPAYDALGSVLGVFVTYYYPSGSAGTCANVTANGYLSLAAFRTWIESGVTTFHPPAPPSRFGALAYSFQGGNWGTSWNYSDGPSAKTAALGYCGSASDCQVLELVQDQCTALAKGDGYTAWANPTTSKASAQAAALGVCGAHSSHCVVVASLCANGGDTE